MNKINALPKLDFNITNKCNLRCIHCCFKSGERQMEEFDIGKIRTTLDEFVRLGGWRIDITGGEPLMRPDAGKILAMAVKDFCLKTELVTNSILMDSKKINECRQLGLKEVAISLDGSTWKKHARIRGVDEKIFNAVLNNIKTLADAGVYTKVNTVVFASNIHDLKNISDLAVKLGASEHGFYFFSPIGRGETRAGEVADPVEWLAIIRNELAKNKNRIKLSLEVPLIETELIKGLDAKCFLQNPWHLQILPNGNIYPCAIMAAYDKPLGNLYETSLKKIWENEELWNEGYYRKNVKPYMDIYASCVNHSGFSELVKSGKYKFICLCKKLKIDEVCRNAKE